MSVPGWRLTASAVVATIGNGAAFTKGRDFGAWLSGWCRNNSPQATERYSAGSANAATSTYARYSSSGARAVLAKPGQLGEVWP